MGSTVGFDGELWLGGVAGVGDVDINEARGGEVGGYVSVYCTEIMFETIFLDIGVYTPLLLKKA